MAVDAVVGIPGSGKSYWGVQEGLRRWIRGYKIARDRHHRLLRLNRKMSADPVRNMPPVDSYQGLAANFDFDLAAVARYLTMRARLTWRESVVLASTIQVVKSIQDLLDLWNTIVIFDEAQLWFNARDYAYFPTEVLSFWTQHRKGGIDVILITQRYEMVDSNIRGVVANVYRARPVPWTLRLYRAVLGKFHLIDDPNRPIFRYTSIMDEAEGTTKSLRIRGLAEAATRVSTVVLDPFIAACYATTGQFYSPATDIHEAVGSQKAAIRNKLNLNYDLTRFRRNRRGRQPLDPPLPIPELAQAYMLGLNVPELVMLRQAEHYDRVAPRERFCCAAPPTEEAARAATVDGAKLDAGSPIENPGAGTPGERGAPAQYNGERRRWGARGTV
ncbi:zonular occludens toxin domain-containing protein [Deinococcus sp. S9]|uniref:zonular occludens toxin domain-containing protein n=1 Tax=Deinococcus sp. S9 TaxID=2545754 RepID=UPI001054FEB4|nr:zonular occludens toxin domain-containing protein [Deinococcus sp. S9]TDE84658.1 hypothetical protein E0686_16030 [Deinococcus sp. S9]